VKKKIEERFSANLLVTGVTDGEDENGRFQLVRASDGKKEIPLRVEGKKRSREYFSLVGSVCFIKAYLAEGGGSLTVTSIEETDEPVTELREEPSEKPYDADTAVRLAESLSAGIGDPDLRAILGTVSGSLKPVLKLHYKGAEIGERLYHALIGRDDRECGIPKGMYVATAIFYHLAQGYFVKENSLVSTDADVRETLSTGFVAAALVYRSLERVKEGSEGLLKTANLLQQNLLMAHEMDIFGTWRN